MTTTESTYEFGAEYPPLDPAVQKQILEAIRAKFSPDVIGLLPRVTDKSSQKEWCDECGQLVNIRHIHLSYVGHAAVTDRILNHDLLWSWEPLASDIDGLPLYRPGPSGGETELWIRLTIAQVTRIGVGVVENGKSDFAKQLISDAIRNGAMRFGIALDLWTKDELESQLSAGGTSTKRKPPKSAKSATPDISGESTRRAPARDPRTEGQVGFDTRDRNKVIAALAKLPEPVRGNDVATWLQELFGTPEPLPAAKLTAEQGAAVMEHLGLLPTPAPEDEQ